MKIVFKAVGAVALAGAMVAAAPASAAVETFASFTQVSAGNSLRWVKTASGGSLYTTTSPTATKAGAVGVNFSYLSTALSSLGPLSASFSMNLTSANGNPAFSGGNFLIQSGLSGSFSFIYTGSAFTVGSTTYAYGANLLSGTIGGASISGGNNSTSGVVSASSAGNNTILYTSDLLSFADASNFDFALSLTSIAQALNRPTATSSLRDFRAAETGSFSSDPAPRVIALPVPETATWALALVGFGAIGGTMRARRSTSRGLAL